MESSNVWMLWVGFGALGLLAFIVLCLVLFVVVRAAALSALRAHSRELRLRAARTGAIDIVPGAFIPQTQSVPTHAAPTSSATGAVTPTATSTDTHDLVGAPASTGSHAAPGASPVRNHGRS